MKITEKTRTIKLRYGLEALIITKPPPPPLPPPPWAHVPQNPYATKGI